MRVLSTGMEWFSESPGGLPRYFADYLEAWQRSGEDVQALIQVQNPRVREELPSYVQGVTLERNHLWSVRWQWRERLELAVSGQTYDVWNPHFSYYAWGAVNRPLFCEIPMVTHFHGPWAYESKVEHGGLLQQTRFAIQKAIEKRVYRASDQFIVLSHAFKDVLVDNYDVPADRVHVIPGGVDVRRFCPGDDEGRVRQELNLPQDKTILVSVRRLAHRMGLDRLIHAVSTLRHDFPKLLLVIIGTGGLERELRALVTELGVEAHVYFAGRVSDEDLPKYYQAADLSVVPSVAFEGFGLITTESLACGTPVVGTPVGGIREVLQGLDGEMLCPGSSVPHLVEGLGRALGHVSRLPTAEQCRAYVLQNYTWDVIIPQIKEVFVSARDGKHSKEGTQSVALSSKQIAVAERTKGV
ncbi:glycosyltransferase family 4 protein [Alicyclobacillus mengziensis]|uniref:Glycosyltransferase family 4 protein n=1 Tax=Alicyclobacillus mengziensis TaxID=2931921 RepID=A0A9X7Z5N2_9BACL|nr:glycosyltransferase family 4 protein [Alicyclobacillus mengziensis]QSO45436.1 glycosyltransferase family 4 protein [Alicyclobacillus mengziensis]